MSNEEKSNSDSSEKNIIFNSNGKILLILKQNWDKIEIKYDSLIKKIEKFSQLINGDLKKDFCSIILQFKNFKDNFKNIFFNTGVSIGNLSSHSNNNDSNSNNNTKLIKESYNNIYNEFLNIESLIKDIISIQSNSKKKKMRRVQNLEKKLHEYIDDIDNLNLDKLKEYNSLVKNNKNKENIENLIASSDFLEQYNCEEFDFGQENNELFNISNNKNINDNKNNESDNKFNQIQINTLNHDSEPTIKNKVKIIDDIVNMQPKNQLDAIQYIKSLIRNKSEDKEKQKDTDNENENENESLEKISKRKNS